MTQDIREYMRKVVSSDVQIDNIQREVEVRLKADNQSAPYMKPGSRVLVALLTVMLWSLCTLSVPSIAEEQSEHIVVTATRSPVEKNQLGGSVTIISRAEIELYQYRYLSSVLQAIPGLYVASNGGVGAQTSLFSQGSESNHTLILIDGIEVTDPALGGVFALENFQLHGVERIEIL